MRQTNTHPNQRASHAGGRGAGWTRARARTLACGARTPRRVARRAAGRYLKLPNGLVVEIQQYYKYLWLRHRNKFEGNNAVSELPQYLQAKVMLHVNR